MLKIYFDDQLLEFSDDSLKRMYINEGAEGTVYRYGDDAIKIYKPDCFSSRLDEKQCEKLMEISTKRVLLPRKITYDENHNFIGYSTPFIEEISCSKIISMKVDEFCDELDVITDDLRLLASHGVEIYDWHIGNLLFNGSLIIGDPGRMIFRRYVDSNWSFKNSRFILNGFLKDDMFNLVRLSKKGRENMEYVFDDYDDMILQMRDTRKDDETVKKYVKRMTR